MKKILCAALIFFAIFAFVYAKISSGGADFKLAEDFPRDALIYVQTQDLPALIKLWNESELRGKYLESDNFKEFEKRHLALKLAERANEIYEATGIFPDLGFAAGLSENKAALAIYDIGKMEFVFIAPASEEKILASKLFQMRSDFEEIKFNDETTVYTKEIQVDRRRQNQKILFANFQGRLILSTSEKYFLQTLENIKGKTPKNCLSAEPVFNRISGKIKPNLATVWINQHKLNDDWYFKHYWLMSDMQNSKNLSSGILDFEIQDEKIIENRVFLRTENKSPRLKIDAETANRVAKFIPENVPFLRIETAENVSFDDLIAETLFDVNSTAIADTYQKTQKNYNFHGWEKSYSYSYLGNDFSEEISDENEDLPEIQNNAEPAEITKITKAAKPKTITKLFSPQTLESPLFFDNRKAVIVSLQNPESLDVKALEANIARKATIFLTADDSQSGFIWSDLASENLEARQMILPSLGWKIFYAVRQKELIFSNSEDFLNEILTTNNDSQRFSDKFDNFSIINLEQRQNAFEKIFKSIDDDDFYSKNENRNSFFTSNVASLLDVISNVKTIEIKQTSEQNFLFEEIDFVLKEKPE